MQAHSLERLPANCFISRQMRYIKVSVSVIVFVNLELFVNSEVEYRSDRDFMSCLQPQIPTEILYWALDSTVFSAA